MSGKLSVVIPIYNTGKYLRECIDSIINQTFIDMEIILVDNKSTDNSGKICDEYGKKDNRIRVIHREEHGWVGDGRNDGIEAAAGEWITFVDSDDWLELDCYERVFAELDNRNVDIFCEGGYISDYSIKRVTMINEINNFDYSNKEKIEILNQRILAPKVRKGHYISFVPVWDKIYRAEFLRQNNIRFAEDILYADDVYFNYIAFRKANRIAGGKYIGYHYRNMAVSITHGFRPDCPDKVYHFLDKFQNDFDISESDRMEKAAFYSRAIGSLCFMLTRCYFHEGNKTPYYQRGAEIIKWKKKEIFRKAIYYKKNPYFTRKQMVIKQILKTPFIFPLALLTRLREWRERVNL